MRGRADKTVANAVLACGWWLEHDGQPVSVEYQFELGDTIYAYQSGVAPEALDIEPGRP